MSCWRKSASFGFALLAMVSVEAQAACARGEVPRELQFLSSQLEEIAENACPRSSAAAARALAEAQVATARSVHFPTVSFSSSAGLQQSWSFDGTSQTNEGDTYTKTLAAGVEASERLWSAGSDALGVAVARLRVRVSEVDEKSARVQTQGDFLRDLLKVVNSARSLGQREKELTKWRELNVSMHRKAKGGHLSQRDTLQSDKETVNAENEVSMTRQTLERDLAMAMTKYDLKRSRLPVEALAALEGEFAALVKVAETRVKSQELANLVARNSVELEKIRFQKEIQNLDRKQKSIQKIAPELRAVVGLNGNYIDDANSKITATRPGATPAQPDWSLTGNVGLRFSMSLWNPRAEALSDESMAQAAQWTAAEASTLRNIELQCESWRSEFANTEARLAGQRRVSATVQALALGNSQLHEAGLVDTFQVIRGLQELYTQERSIMDLENQLRLVAMNGLLAELFGRL